MSFEIARPFETRVPLAGLTTLGVGGPVRYLARCSDPEGGEPGEGNPGLERPCDLEAHVGFPVFSVSSPTRLEAPPRSRC